MPAQYEVPTAWGVSKFHDLELPSGGIVQVKQVDLQAIVNADLLDEFDRLSGVVEDRVVKPAKGKQPVDRPKKKPTKSAAESAKDKAMREFFKKDNLDSLVLLMDRILPQIVVQPRVHSSQFKNESGAWTVLPAADREEGVIYVDTVPFADQMVILDFGMRGMNMDGLQSFRLQPEPPVAVVAPEPKPADSPE